jgi:molecular chaperone DnaK
VNHWTLLIDFGTSFSRAAIVDEDGRIEPVEVDGAPAMPSAVWADQSGRLVTGAAAEQQGLMTPERLERAPALSIGAPGPLRLGRHSVDPTTAVAAVLRRLLSEALLRRHRRPPAQVRLVVPARWDDARREVLLAAARQAGLDRPALEAAPQLVDQSVAAALRLAQLGRFGVGTMVALCGLGGGNAETTVIESTSDGVLVRAVGGVEGVGGELFDERLFRQVIAHARSDWDAEGARNLWEPPDAHWRRAAEELNRAVRQAKEDLSALPSVTLTTSAPTEISLRLSRFELEGVLRPQILRAARELASTIELAGVRPHRLDAVLITGGSSAIPLVTRAIYDVMGMRAQMLPELGDSGLLLGAASWTPTVQVGSPSPADPGRGPTGDRIPVPITVTGRQTGEEAAEAAAAAAAAAAATGSIDLSALALRRTPKAGPEQPAPGPAGTGEDEQQRRRRWLLVATVLVLGFLVVGALAVNGIRSS